MRQDVMDPREAAEAEALFAKPASDGGALMVPGAGQLPNITISDAIITAQKVSVERDLPKVIRNIKTLAAVAGEDWYYRFPVKKKGGGVDQIEGPTIKCAQNVAREYGNCQVDCRAMDQGTSWMIYARFVDYETGFSLTRPFQADKAKSTMNTKDAGRQQEIAFAIGVSKATRNVITNALETFTNLAFEEAKNNLVEKVGKRLVEYRQRVRDRLKQLDVDEKRAEAQIGRKAEEWLAPDVARVIAELKSVADGMAAADDIWPPLAPPEPKRGDFQKPAAVTQAEPPANATEATETAKSAPPHDAQTGEAKEPAASGKAEVPAETVDPWFAIGTGQEGIRDSILALIDRAKSADDLDAIDKANAARWAKFTQANRAAITVAMENKKEDLGAA
jgi:hypothetical protein